MKDFINPLPYLTDPTERLGVLLTLIFFAIFPIHGFSAATSNNPYAISNSIQFDAVDKQESDKRLQSIIDYAKQELPHMMPGLPSEIREPATWALGGMREAGNLFNFGLSSGEDVGADITAVAAIFKPVAAFMRPAAPEESQATWFAPDYHHRHGILPTHDSIVMGTHTRQDLLHHYMRFDVHPYVGQNLVSSRGYYGADITLDLASPSETSATTKPWGKIAVSYTNGDSSLMDHGRGLDLHGELRFSDKLTLNTGMRQSDTSGSSDYVLLQWKMAIK